VEGHTVTVPAADQSPEDTDRPNWRFIVEVVVAVFAIGTFAATACQAQSTADQARLTADQGNQTVQELSQNRYQSVYDRVLELEKVPIDEPKVAAYLIGGERLPDDISPGDPRRAAVLYALDVYQYVWAQLSPPMPSGVRPGSFILRETATEPPKGVSANDWEAWQTWSETIGRAFVGAPGMCQQLAESADAFADDFLAAVGTLKEEDPKEGCTDEQRSLLIEAAND